MHVCVSMCCVCTQDRQFEFPVTQLDSLISLRFNERAKSQQALFKQAEVQIRDAVGALAGVCVCVCAHTDTRPSQWPTQRLHECAYVSHQGRRCMGLYRIKAR